MSGLKNRLVWSYSRMQTLRFCRRKYYYQHYLKWGGWEATATPEQQAAHRLSKMRSLDLLAGEIVHQGIAEALRHYRNRWKLLTPEESLQTAWLRWRKALDDSRSGRWRGDSRTATCLLEDYYQHDNREAKAERNWQRVETCLCNFWRCQAWERLRTSPPRRWLALESEYHKVISIAGVDAQARIDLGYDGSSRAQPKSRCWIFDWKTGPESSLHRAQIRYYALYAQHHWDFPEEAIKARLIYLYPDLYEEAVTLTAADLEEARAMLVHSFQDMHLLLADVEENTPLPITAFPVTDQQRLCRYCQYQEICTDRGQTCGE